MRFFQLCAVAAAIFGAAAAQAEKINAELTFPDNADLLRCGRTIALKTTVRQRTGDWLVIDGTEFARFSPANDKGRLVASGGSLAPLVVTHASDLKYVFWLEAAGLYDVWMHVKFPRRGFYNHSECMDHGVPRIIHDSEDPKSPGQWLPPDTWHWVKTTTYKLVRGPHHWQWLPPGAWCAGCELDRIVLVRANAKVTHETATKENRIVERSARATVQARRIRLGRVQSWRLASVFDHGDGRVLFECSTDQKIWSPVSLGRSIAVKEGEENLYIRLNLVAAPEGKRQPIVYDYSFEIERKQALSAAVAEKEEPVSGIRPLRIIPDRIVYAEGQTGRLDVVVSCEDAAGGAATAELIVEEFWGLDGGRRELYREKLSMKNAERQTVCVPYPGSRVKYGHEVRATIGKRSRSEFFNVIDDWWRVNQGGYLQTAEGKIMPSVRKLLDYYGYTTNDWSEKTYPFMYQKWAARMPGMGPFMGYDNIETRWQMQRSSTGGNAVTLEYPDEKRWPNVQNHPRTTGDIRRDTQVTQARGFHHTRYTIGYLSSGYGVELARKNPEFVLRGPRGEFAGSYMDRSFLRPDFFAQPDSFLQIPFMWFEPNFFRPDAFEWAIDDLVKVVDGIGEDGVYFDGRYMQHAGYDYFGNNLGKRPDRDEIIARNMKRSLEKLFAVNTNAYIWSNGTRAGNPELELANHPQTGLLKETQWPFLLNPSRADHSYRGFRDGLIRARDAVWRPGKYVKNPPKSLHCGYLMSSWVAKDTLKYDESWVMASHIISIVASVCAHPHAYPPTFRPFKQMMTRYSELFWHQDREIVDDANAVFELDSLRRIWWDDCVYVRETADWSEYTIHLMNAPEGEYCDETVVKAPAKADDVEITVKSSGEKGLRVWAVSPYSRDASRLEPSCRELPVTGRGQERTVAVPPFRYYTLLVVRKYK